MTAAAHVVDAARSYAALGWPICATAGKRPLGSLLSHDRDWRVPCVLADLLDRLARPEATGLGFLGGFGVTPLDFDSDDGETWWARECAAAGLDADQWPVVRTAKGRHRYVGDAGAALSNSEGALRTLGINVRGRGHCVLPPSPHPDGGCYRWERPLENLAAVPPCPGFVIAKIAERQQHHTPHLRIAFKRPRLPVHDPRVRHIAYARAALMRSCDQLARTGEGSRNTTLNNIACAMGNLAHLGGFDEGQARAALHAACMTNGLIGEDGERSFAATFASGWTCGSASQRHPPERSNPLPNAFKASTAKASSFKDWR